MNVTGANFGNYQIEPSNIERAENKKPKVFQKYPQCLHKVGGLTKEVASDDELAAALKLGWKESPIVAEEKSTGDKITEKTVSDAIALVEAADAAALVQLEADELAGTARVRVLKAIEKRKDAI